MFKKMKKWCIKEVALVIFIIGLLITLITYPIQIVYDCIQLAYLRRSKNESRKAYVNFDIFIDSRGHWNGVEDISYLAWIKLKFTASMDAIIDVIKQTKNL